MTLISNLVEKPTTTKEISVQEKILLEKQLPFTAEKKGPTIDLYFHELAKGKSFAQAFFRYITTLSLTFCFAVTFPIIALFIKLFTSEPIFKKTIVTGKRGLVFIHYS